MTKPGLNLPYADTKVAKLLRTRIDALSSKKNQREIALEMGYEKANILSMYKRGEAKIPLDRIPAMAKALEVDPGLLFRMALEQWWPGQEKVIRQIFGGVTTSNQQAWLHAIAAATGEEDPDLTPARQQGLSALLTE